MHSDQMNILPEYIALTYKNVADELITELQNMPIYYDEEITREAIDRITNVDSIVNYKWTKVTERKNLYPLAKYHSVIYNEPKNQLKLIALECSYDVTELDQFLIISWLDLFIIVSFIESKTKVETPYGIYCKNESSTALFDSLDSPKVLAKNLLDRYRSFIPK